MKNAARIPTAICSSKKLPRSTLIRVSQRKATGGMQDLWPPGTSHASNAQRRATVAMCTPDSACSRQTWALVVLSPKPERVNIGLPSRRSCGVLPQTYAVLSLRHQLSAQ